jgi:Na+/proline symporter
MSDFMGWRFGPVAKTLVVLVAMFNMSIAMLAEYTTIGTIFSDFVGSVSFPIIIIIGVLTLLYTAAGGLAVSIATDQVQGIASAIMALVVTVFVAVTYK